MSVEEDRERRVEYNRRAVELKKKEVMRRYPGIQVSMHPNAAEGDAIIAISDDLRAAIPPSAQCISPRQELELAQEAKQELVNIPVVSPKSAPKSAPTKKVNLEDLL